MLIQIRNASADVSIKEEFRGRRNAVGKMSFRIFFYKLAPTV